MEGKFSLRVTIFQKTLLKLDEKFVENLNRSDKHQDELIYIIDHTKNFIKTYHKKIKKLLIYVLFIKIITKIFI